ncbi:MAG: hypothetical protein C5B54_11190 [Acidobacteria bacterium]|nr:MAG: hypothetical protein C5B54_11190 [Acidobacteriota bacterium]
MQTSERLDLTIVIVTYNSESVILSCLESLGERMRQNILIVDNASTDKTVSLIQDCGVNVICLEKNEGFAAAANIAAKAAKGKYVCFLNPDCTVGQNFFIEALAIIEKSSAACVVPSLLDEDGLKVEGRQPGYTRWKLVDNILQTNYGQNPVSRLLRTLPNYHDSTWFWPHGACFILEREKFLNLQLDARFFLYMEDVDFGRRLANAGGAILSVDHKVVHKSRQGSSISKRERLSLLNRGRIRYAKLYYGWPFAAFLQVVAFPGSMLRKFLQYRS